MEKFSKEKYQNLINGVTKKVQNQDKSYKEEFQKTFQYLSQFVNEDVKLPIVQELKSKIPELSAENINSKQNLELFKELTMTLEMLKPI